MHIADGPVVSFYGFPYATRMVAVQLTSGDVWIWSPVALTDRLYEWVNGLGPVRYIVSPNKIHHLFLAEWAERWPEARLYAPPGLAQRKPDLHFHAELSDQPEEPWAADLDQVVFRGSFMMEEVVFFHRPSRTAIFGDLIQRHPTATMTGWKGWLMRLDGLVGENGSAPREWRASFLRRGNTRKARDRVLGWHAERLLVAHGDCVKAEAADIIEKALGWI